MSRRAAGLCTASSSEKQHSGKDGKKEGKAWETHGKWLCTLLREASRAVDQRLTGIEPRHRLLHLSLLPSGPDEVRNRLLRGGRSG